MSENQKSLSTQNGNYSEDSIKVLEGLEAVRKRPAMYIGDISDRGLHHLINEVVDNSIDETLAGYCDVIEITLHSDGSCTVSDNGRGIPTGPHPVMKISTLEVVMCTLHAGGKFDKDSYKVSGGLHGVGVSCVNALSSDTTVIVKRDGKIFKQTYSEGIPTSPVEVIGTTTETGTSTRFLPDASIFKTVIFRTNRVIERLRELAFLNPQVKIIFRDERENIEEIFHYEGGLLDFVNYINVNSNGLTQPVMIAGEGNDDLGAPTQVEVCFQYTDSYKEEVLSYVNNINTLEGGTHVKGFRAALTRSMNTYATNNMSSRKKQVQIIGDDFKEGLTVIISVKVSEPQFEGQTKTKLGNSDVEGIVRTVVAEKLNQYLDENPLEANKILDKAILSAEGRIASKKAKELVRRKNSLENSTLPGKLADCSLNTPEDTEVFIVEGDSAGGSAKQGRDRRFQAILPIKGKILNVEKARPHKILENEEIRTIITALGTSFGDDFDPDKVRYGKIILMADADVDGSHIRTLLLTLFYNHFRELIIRGKLYIAQPPLYKIKKGKSEYYAFDEKEREIIIDRIKKDSKKKDVDVTADLSEEELNSKLGISLSRFKGLGEMNPDQLWETTMNPETRTMARVEIGEAAEATGIFKKLMGEAVEPRRQYIEQNAKYVQNLDV